MFNKNRNLQYEFLPSVLEITETPPTIWSHVVLWVMFVILSAMLMWAYFGQIDEVVTARGKLVTGDGTIQIKAPAQGKIKQILVKDGEKIDAEQVVFEYDSAAIDLEIAGVKNNLKTLKEELASFRGESGGAQDLVNAMGGSLNSQLQINNLSAQQLQLQINNHLKNLEQLNSQLQALHDQETLLVATLESDLMNNPQEIMADLSRVRSQIQAYQNLVKDDQNKVEILKLQQAEKTAQSGYLWQNHKQVLAQRALDLNKQISDLEQTLNKMNLAKDELQVKSPSAGTVTLMRAKTGEMIATGEVFAVIVPDEAQFSAEILISDKDIGRVSVGDVVEVKVGSYNYQKHGVLSGEVVQISADAITNESGLWYQVRVNIASLETNIGKKLNLTSGMGVTTDIKIGKRRIIEFFTEPMLQKVEDGFKI